MNGGPRFDRQTFDATAHTNHSPAAPSPGPRGHDSAPSHRRRSKDYFLCPAHTGLGLGQTGRSGVETGWREIGQEIAGGVPLEELLGGQARDRHAVEGQGRPTADDPRSRGGDPAAQPAQHADPAVPSRSVDPLLASTDRRAHVHPPRRIEDRRMLVRGRASGQTFVANRKSSHPPATILTISSRSPALSWRFVNSDGATAWPLCSTTTLRGRSPCVTRNSAMVQGSLAGTSWPLAVRDDWVIERIFERTGFVLL